MTKADTIFKENIERILKEGVFSEQARPKYKDGTVANSKYVTGAFSEYDLSKGEFPITTLRPIAIKSAIKEVLWIYQDQSNSLEVLNDKYNVHYWNDWEVGDTGTIASAMVPLLRNTTLSISFSNSWKPILGTAAILFRSGITKLSKKQMGCSRAPFRPCLMSGVLMGKSIWMRP